MHPASSIIIFTSFSGFGFGLLFYLGFGLSVSRGILELILLVIAYLSAVGGLIASTFHLGHPERAFKAYKQWKTSWLSREAWLATGALLFMTVYGIGLVFFDQVLGFAGIIGGLLSIATVFSTAMIYANIKAVPRWNTSLTPILFLVIAVTGASIIAGLGEITLILLLITAIIQVAYWIKGDRAFNKSKTTINTATGLGREEMIRLFASPHTGTNYLLREFIYIIGRRHASKLRLISLVMMIGIPIVLLSNSIHFGISMIATICHLAGVLVSRWLFFAQAEHVVGLYYGKRVDT